jgi:hypothetical protein
MTIIYDHSDYGMTVEAGAQVVPAAECGGSFHSSACDRIQTLNAVTTLLQGLRKSEAC